MLCLTFLAFDCLFLLESSTSHQHLLLQLGYFSRKCIMSTFCIDMLCYLFSFEWCSYMCFFPSETIEELWKWYLHKIWLAGNCLCWECRFTGFHKTIQLDRKKLVELIDLFEDHELSWEEFSAAVKELHMGRMSQPTRRRVIPGQPKEEDYFYANPHECLGPARKRRQRLKHIEIWMLHV